MKNRRLWPLLLLASSNAFGAITFVGSDTDVGGSDTSQTLSDATIAAAEGDALACLSTHSSVDGSWTVPADHTVIDEVLTASSAHEVLTRKIRGSGAGDALTFTYSGTAGSMRTTCGAWSGDTADLVLDVAYVRASHYNTSSNDGALTAPQPITTATDGAVILLIQHIEGDGSFTAVAPTNYAIDIDNQVNNRVHVFASRVLATAGTDTPSAWGHTGVGGSADGSTFTIAFSEVASAPVAPSFSSGPTVAPATDGYTIGGTVDEDATVYVTACLPSETQPSIAQVKTGDCGSGSDAAIAASDAWTADSADSFLLAASNSLIRHDICIVASNAGGDSTLDCSNTDEDRSPASGWAITELTSIAATSIFSLSTDSTGDTTCGSIVIANMTDTSDFQVGMQVGVTGGCATTGPLVITDITASSITVDEDSNAIQSNVTVTSNVYYNPTVAIGDMIEYETTVTCAAGTDVVVVAADGNFAYPEPPDTATCNATLSEFDYRLQDVSVGEFTNPDTWPTPDTVYINNTAPQADDDSLEPLVIDLSDMTPVDFSSLFSDEDGHALTFAERGSTLPGTLSISSAGVLSGDPAAEIEAGITYRIIGTDIGGLSAVSQPLLLFIVDTWTMTDITGGTVSEGSDLIVADAAWLSGQVSINATFGCSSSVAENDIISQTPLAGAEVVAEPAISAVVSSGTC